MRETRFYQFRQGKRKLNLSPFLFCFLLNGFNSISSLFRRVLLTVWASCEALPGVVSSVAYKVHRTAIQPQSLRFRLDRKGYLVLNILHATVGTRLKLQVLRLRETKTVTSAAYEKVNRHLRRSCQSPSWALSVAPHNVKRRG